MNKQMVALWNRVGDAIYKACHLQGIDYKSICRIQGEVKTIFDLNLNQENPFIKKLNRTNKIEQVLNNVSEYNATEFVKSMALTIRDIMLQLEGKQLQTKELSSSKVKTQKYLEYNECEIKELLSELMVYYDVLSDLEECETELEMNEVVERLQLDVEPE